MKTVHLAVSAAALIAASATAAAARDQIRIVGSSTVFPYTQAVAENFSSETGAPSPIVESTGTGGGFQIFCEGIGENTPDITGASRAMKPSEYELCQQNGVTEISEALIGYDGLTVATSAGNDGLSGLTLPQLYKAVAAEVAVDGALVPNPYRTWSEIDPSLPDAEITVYGPPPTSGTRDAFVELAMHAACGEMDDMKALADASGDAEWVNTHCSRMRTDGPFIEAGENDNLIVQRLEADPNAVGIFGYSFLYENQDKLKGVMLDEVEADLETIGDGSYPLSRPLYFYVKNAHRGVIANLDEFIEEYMADETLAADGYLADRGLVALGDEERARLQQSVISATSMQAPQ